MISRRIWQPLGLLAALVFLPGLAGAQSATIAGRVIDRATQQPLAEAQVFVAGTQRGARTGEDGTFRITVPPGTVQLRVMRIGYTSEVQTVAAGVGATATVTFALSPTATTLDEVVVTATGQTERRRESGVTTARIDSGAFAIAAVQNLSDVLSSRAAGVVVQQASGTTGGSSRIRVRGSNSINLSNDPLLVVDGIRVNNNPNSTSIGVGGQTPSRFNDINPDDVENIEVIKGPAASALYGTAASNGVIQVTTKRGKAGRARWNTNFEYGRLNEVGEYPANYTQIGVNTSGTRNTNCNLDAQQRRVCTIKPDSIVSTNPIKNLSPFRDGWRESFGANVSGGSDVAQYYIGGDFDREEGVYAVNWQRRTNIRGNVTAQPRPNVQLSFNSGYTSSRLRLPQNDNNVFGAISGGLIGKAFDCHRPSQNPELGPNDVSCGVDTLSRGYRTANHPGPRFFAVNTRQDVEHLIASSNGNWQPASWLNFIATAGVDLIDRHDNETLPKGGIDVFFPEGYRQSNRAQIRTYTGNASAVGTFSLRSNLRSVSTAGTQWTREIFQRTDAFGEVLLPGTASLGGTSARFSVGESSSDIVTLGYLFQQRLEWREKVYLTGAIRADKNSNFGVNLPFVRYPSVNLSWVVGEEPFFPRISLLNSLRLRFAYGESGQRPDFRQADRFFNPVAVSVQGNEVSGVTIGGAGNANLQPERTREIEFGFDAGLFEDRVSVEFTRYQKQTRDALIGRRLAPSVGATTTQLVNLGRVDNKGFEYLIDFKAWELVPDRFEFGVTLNGSVNDNVLVDLGKGITPIIFGLGGDTQRHQNGYPLGAYFARRIVSFEDRNNDGVISRVNCPTYGTTANPQIVGGPACEIVLSDSAEYLGNPFGRTEIAIAPAVTLFNWLKVRALFDRRGGLTLNNSTEFFRCNVAPNICPAIQDKRTPLAEQARAVATFMGTRGTFFEKADFTKLRELSFTFLVPARLAGAFRASSASVTIAGRNLKTWTDYTGLDPELNVSSAANFNTADFLTQPPVKYWITRVNLTF